jgi:hypothetical protein
MIRILSGMAAGLAVKGFSLCVIVVSFWGLQRHDELRLQNVTCEEEFFAAVVAARCGRRGFRAVRNRRPAALTKSARR